MRYFEIKPEFKEVEASTQKEIIIDYRDLFRNVLLMDCQHNLDELMRLSKLYSKFLNLETGSVLEIEDQDFTVIQTKKLPAYVGTVKGFAIAVPGVIAFFDYLKNLPTQDPKKEETQVA